MKKFVKALVMFGWVFICMDLNGNPAWKPFNVQQLSVCNDLRGWAIKSHFNVDDPAKADAALVAKWISPCVDESVTAR